MAEEINLASGGGMTDEAKAIKASVSERIWEAMIQVAMGKSIDEMGEIRPDARRFENQFGRAIGEQG